MKTRTLIIGTFLMLFLGLIYAWSLFAAPLEEAFNWSRSQTSITFSISMTMFCLGSIFSGMILKKRPPGNIILFSAALFLIGFFTASRIANIWGLYMSYGGLCGLGVGLSYNAILSTVPKWFPDRAGFATGTLLMGMGLGSLILGIIVNKAIDLLKWRVAFKILSIVFFVVFLTGSFLIKNPVAKKKSAEIKKIIKNYTLFEMLKTSDFWMLFIWSVIASSIGLGIVSNAGYMATEFGITSDSLALIVGMVSIGNGVGRLLFGTIADRIGGDKAMIISNLVFIGGLLLIILANKTNILSFIIIGFIMGGIGYGSSPTLSAALTKKKFGEKYYPLNLSAIVMALIPASLIGPTISAGVYQQTGQYRNVYFIMIVMAIIAFLPVKIYKE
ncbi:MAG: MFS transporter [Firmicutes bacterium]|nr:MFS transporter [Bacillota bacterium]